MNISYPIAGIDIAKDKHDLAVLSEDGTFNTWTIEGDEKSLQKCSEKLIEMGVKLIVLEATGGYEMPFMKALLRADLAVARVNPMRVREFAKGIGQMSKTDREDSQLLALYGERARPESFGLPDENILKLKGLSLRRRQLVDARSNEKKRLKQACLDSVRMSIERQIAFLNEEIESIENEMENFIEGDETLLKKSELVRSFPGIGKVTSFMLLADLPELGHCTHRQLNALVGVAPYNDDSAKRRGQRHIKGGRFELRRALYMGAQTGYRHNLVLKSLYDRLRKKGRPHKSALIACINKMLKILNTMVKKDTAFDRNHATA